MVVYYTGLGFVLLLVLWIFTANWEWSVPEGLEGKIREWKKKWYLPQGIVRFVGKNSIFEQEQFAYSLRWVLPKVERELGLPVHVEVELDGQDIALTEEELRYIICLTRSFTEFTWRIQERVECKSE